MKKRLLFAVISVVLCLVLFGNVTLPCHATADEVEDIALQYLYSIQNRA